MLDENNSFGWLSGSGAIVGTFLVSFGLYAAIAFSFQHEVEASRNCVAEAGCHVADKKVRLDYGYFATKHAHAEPPPMSLTDPATVPGSAP